MMPQSLQLTGGAGGAAGPASGTANNGISDPFNTPFNFDSSGWVVNFGQQKGVSAGGNTGANPSNQTASATPSGGTGGLFSGGNLPLILGAIGLFLVLSHKL